MGFIRVNKLTSRATQFALSGEEKSASSPLNANCVALSESPKTFSPPLIFHPHSSLLNAHELSLDPQLHFDNYADCKCLTENEASNIRDFLEQPETATVDEASLDFGGRTTICWENTSLDLAQQKRLVNEYSISHSDSLSLIDVQAEYNENSDLGHVSQNELADLHASIFGPGALGLSEDFTFDIDPRVVAHRSSFGFSEEVVLTQGVLPLDEQMMRLPQTNRPPELLNNGFGLPDPTSPLDLELDQTSTASSTSPSSESSKSSLATDPHRSSRLALPRMKLPFQCPQCQDAFSSKRNLNRHTKTHQSIVVDEHPNFEKNVFKSRPENSVRFLRSYQVGTISPADLLAYYGEVDRAKVDNDTAHWNCQDYVIEIVEALLEECVIDEEDYLGVRESILSHYGPL
ncbi:MAG: hypothetical protein Q9160_003566 [Pyrenula sp. 1 TL-2023]